MSEIKPEIQKLIDRGNVTAKELKELRLNSWEWDAIIPALTDEAFFIHVARCENNASRVRLPAVTYDDVLRAVLLPDLIRRYHALKKKYDEATHIDPGYGDNVW